MPSHFEIDLVPFPHVYIFESLYMLTAWFFDDFALDSFKKSLVGTSILGL